VALTYVEKQAGRLFRQDCEAALNQRNEQDQPTYEVPFFLGIYRHLCSARNNRSTGLELKEQYWVSEQCPGVPAGRFGFIFREGRCRACGQTARSRVGRLVDGWQRPPITGRVARS
jgi:hypothetical protein